MSGTLGALGNSSGENAPTGDRRPTGLSVCGVWRSVLPLVEEWTDVGRSRTFGFLGTGGGTWKGTSNQHSNEYSQHTPQIKHFLRGVFLTLGFFLSDSSARQEIVILEGSVLLLSWSSGASWLLQGEGSEPPSSGPRRISVSNSGSITGSSRRGWGSGRGGRSKRDWEWGRNG